MVIETIGYLEIGKKCGAVAHFEIGYGENAKQALAKLRANEPINDVDESIGEVLFAALAARESDAATHAVDVSFQWQSPAGQQKTRVRFVEEKLVSAMNRPVIDNWLQERKSILVSNEISVSVLGLDRWKLPTSEELHRLAYISDARISNVFGPTPARQAISKFEEGDVIGCAAILKSCSLTRTTPQFVTI